MSTDVIRALGPNIILVSEPGEPKLVFFMTPQNSDLNELEVVSYVSMKALKESLSPELYGQVKTALGLTK